MTRRSEKMQADVAARIALLRLSGMGPARIRWLLDRNEPAEVVARMRAGEMPVARDEAPTGVTADQVGKWMSEIAGPDPSDLLLTHLDEGWTILHPSDPEWPFADEPEPPLLLFCAGDVDLLAVRPAVAVVGTRRCTSVGRRVAHDLGLDLAAAGIAVVSGLALGIDAAAHHGAAEGGGALIGVVGSGLNMVYPPRNRALWDRVAADGLLISEYPAGTKPSRWSFPARNRLIASLADAVVIVESHARGGALLTAEEAADRGRPVLAIPGSVLSPASDGTNGLIVDGVIPVRDADDILTLLGISTAGPEVPDQVDAGLAADSAPPAELPETVSAALADTLRREVAVGSVALDHLLLITGKAPVEVLAAVQSLVASGEIILEGSTVISRHQAGDS